MTARSIARTADLAMAGMLAMMIDWEGGSAGSVRSAALGRGGMGYGVAATVVFR